ncbi:MAG TPA: RIP metalloprotease RseP [Anaerohalosphaeraceae bacterium]|nr:RIP metalloprotease RseP [Anaerohalosphaeraceae bacterium]HRT49993.1 RIP metalloprotease RseP [Anaerohalosphaeraceae bacterium]HRT85709.1 RIP metalloprotease RseP [Anaerohalosphaeraceae bacterium]
MTERTEPKNVQGKPILRPLLTGIILVLAAVFVFKNPVSAWYILLVAIGFGAVIMIHEFGHFIVAKLSGIKVEAFSIGFPPTLLGLQKTEKGLRVRILPGSPRKDQEDDAEPAEAGTVFMLGKGNGKASDTEYRIGLVPFGGFVKMLGQEDTGAAEVTDDPRSYANKPVIVRIAVVAAGVIFNAISAFLIFMIVFLVGMDLSPAVVGNVQLNSPAERAGIVAGDRIVEVNGERFVDFTNVVLAPALSARGEEITFGIERADGTRKTVNVVAEESPMAALPLRELGIERASTLTIERGITDPEIIEKMKETFGVQPGDVAKSVNGEPVNAHWELTDKIENSLTPQASIAFERTDPKTGQTEIVNVDVPLYWPARRNNFKVEFDLAHIAGIVPRIKVLTAERATELQPRDIITKIGDVENPTYEELREVTIAHEGREMPITVLRNNKEITITRIPKKPHGSDRVQLGIVPALDVEHAVAAGVVDIGGNTEKPAIPKGATITAVAGEPVGSFYDIVQTIRANKGRTVEIAYEADGVTGSAAIAVPADCSIISAVSEPTTILPFEYLKETYKASSPLQAISWGVKKTHMFIAQTYVTLQRLITREVSPKALSGPVGIVSMSYKIASQSIPDYIYFLGLISSCIAVMNLLPLPIVDGGVIVLLIIEKLKGSPISPRVQEAISYAGLVFLGAVFLWLTYNDITNLL